MNKIPIPLVDLKSQYLNIKTEINEAIDSVINNSDFIMGKAVFDLEKEFAGFLNIKYALGVSSGTDALHLALYALDVGKNDEVILPSHTFTATAEVIVWLGAKPVFADIDEKTYTIDPDKIEKKITKRTKAIIPVHLYGHPADMNMIMNIAKRYKIPVVEDCAQAHGAEVNGGKVGTIGDIGCFSFYPGKNLGAYGDAGMVVTNNQKYYEKIRLLRNHGRTEKYLHQIVGFGNRLDTIQAAILAAKLKCLSRWNNLRRKNALVYSLLLPKKPGIILPFEAGWARAVYHLYVLRVKKRDKLRDYLKSRGIETGIHYPIPLHLQPAYKFLDYKKGSLPITEKIVKEIISLPLYPELKESQIRYICTCIKNFYS